MAQPGNFLNGPSYQALQPMAVQPMNIKATLPSDQAGKALDWQGGMQAGGMAVNTMIAGFNYGLQSEAISAQKDVALAYYGAQEKMAGYQKQIALRQLDLQETSVIVQQQMHTNQLQFEERIARLESKTQVRLAQIHEDGKTARARQVVLSDAFQARSNWGNYGTPTIPMQWQ
jgi:hypothetical protein